MAVRPPTRISPVHGRHPAPDRPRREAGGGRSLHGGLDGTHAGARSGATLDRATALNALLRDLAAAGCPLIEIHEPAATAIGTDDGRA